MAIVNGDFDNSSNFISSGATVPVDQDDTGLWATVPSNYAVTTDVVPPGVLNWSSTLDETRIRSVYQVASVPDSAVGEFFLKYDVNYDPGSTTATDRRFNVTLYGIKDTGATGWTSQLDVAQMPFGAASNPIQVMGGTVEIVLFDEPGFVGGSGQPSTGGFIGRELIFNLAADQYDYLVVRLAGRTIGDNDEILQYDNIQIVPEPSALTMLLLGVAFLILFGKRFRPAVAR